MNIKNNKIYYVKFDDGKKFKYVSRLNLNAGDKVLVNGTRNRQIGTIFSSVTDTKGITKLLLIYRKLEQNETVDFNNMNYSKEEICSFVKNDASHISNLIGLFKMHQICKDNYYYFEFCDWNANQIIKIEAFYYDNLLNAELAYAEFIKEEQDINKINNRKYILIENIILHFAVRNKTGEKFKLSVIDYYEKNYQCN